MDSTKFCAELVADSSSMKPRFAFGSSLKIDPPYPHEINLITPPNSIWGGKHKP